MLAKADVHSAHVANMIKMLNDSMKDVLKRVSGMEEKREAF